MTKQQPEQVLPTAQIGTGLENGDKQAPVFLFAHGAGAGMDSDFMEAVAQGMAQHGVRVIRFEFPYMQLRRLTGSKRPPDRAPKLLAHFKAEMEAIDAPLIIGGKSMGGRMASLLAAQLADEQDALVDRIKGVVAFGYPFHPSGKPEKLRTEHLPQLTVPMLVLQGSRDKLGDHDLVSGLSLPNLVETKWFEDGDHDLKPRKASGFSHDQHIDQAIELAAKFVSERLA